METHEVDSLPSQIISVKLQKLGLEFTVQSSGYFILNFIIQLTKKFETVKHVKVTFLHFMFPIAQLLNKCICKVHKLNGIFSFHLHL